MYQAYWGLHEPPFPSGLDPRHFFRSPTHEEALARLLYLAEESRRVGLLLGGTGSGKSLLLQVFRAELLRAGHDVAHLSLLALGPHEFLRTLAAELGASRPAHPWAGGLWRAISDRLRENRYQRLRTVVLLDDADEAGDEVLDQISRLAELDPSPEARLTIVLAAANHRLRRLGPRLLAMSELRVDVQPWERDDTAQYLAESLRRAGRSLPAFEEQALARLHVLAHGIPRRVKQLAHLALLAAAGQELQRVDEATIEAVCEELGVKEAYAVRL